MENYDSLRIGAEQSFSKETVSHTLDNHAFARKAEELPKAEHNLAPFCNDDLSELSESSIANKILFRETYAFKQSERWAGFLEGKTKSGVDIASPTQTIYGTEKGTIQNIFSSNFCIYPLDEVAAHFVAQTVAGTGISKSDRGQSDYLYLTARLASLSGPQLSGHRYKVAKLERNYNIRVERIDSHNIGSAYRVLDNWMTEKNTDCMLDYVECRNALTFLEVMKLTGYIFFVESTPCAITILDDGFRGMVVSLFQKVVSGYRGLDAFCVRFKAKSFLEKPYVNLCQDLGILGLRKWKESFHPDRILDKYFAFRAH